MAVQSECKSRVACYSGNMPGIQLCELTPWRFFFKIPNLSYTREFVSQCPGSGAARRSSLFHKLALNAASGLLGQYRPLRSSLLPQHQIQQKRCASINYASFVSLRSSLTNIVFHFLPPRLSLRQLNYPLQYKPLLRPKTPHPQECGCRVIV